MYQPAVPDTEFLEIHNTSTTHAFDLTGFRVRGMDFDFEPGTIIEPNGFLCWSRIWRPFRPCMAGLAGGRGLQRAAAPGRGALAHGATGDQRVEPERIVDEVTYEHGAAMAAGGQWAGAIPATDRSHSFEQSSGQLGGGADPIGEIYTLSYWYLPDPNGANLTMRLRLSETTPGAIRITQDVRADAVASVQYTPGAPNSVRATLPLFPLLWLNEIQPVNVSGPTDDQGERDPWVELYNAGTETLDLAHYYLTDDFGVPTKWEFPAGASIGPGQFRLVWLDGDPAQTRERVARQFPDRSGVGHGVSDAGHGGATGCDRFPAL
jgi:hypothetical protein